MSGDCREVPDVSANAGASVAIYCTEGGREGCAGGWTGFGGTSVAAPTWAALFALADASTACAGNALGFANPALYSIAGGSGYASAFNDITAGNNDLLGAHNGMYAAGPGYDMASGLGTPIAGDGSGSDSGLVTQLCKIAPMLSKSSLGVSKLTPIAGPKAGGTKVTITGSGFTKVSAVHFGSKKAKSFKVDSATKLVAVAPGGGGTVYVTVTTAGATSEHVAASKFTYLAAPILLHLSPIAGPKAGGTKVTITGSGFTSVSAVHFGSKKAKSFKVDSTSKLVAVAPKGTGTATVTVTTPGGTSRLSSATQFYFR